MKNKRRIELILFFVFLFTSDFFTINVEKTKKGIPKLILSNKNFDKKFIFRNNYRFYLLYNSKLKGKKLFFRDKNKE